MKNLNNTGQRSDLKKNQLPGKKPQHCIIFDIDGTLITEVQGELDLFVFSFSKVFDLSIDTINKDEVDSASFETDLELFWKLFFSVYNRNPTTSECQSFITEYCFQYKRAVENSNLVVSKKLWSEKLFDELDKSNNFFQLGVITGNFSIVGHLKLELIKLNKSIDFFGFSDIFLKKSSILKDIFSKKIISVPETKQVTYIGNSVHDHNMAAMHQINYIHVSKRNGEDVLTRYKDRKKSSSIGDHDLFFPKISDQQ